MNHLLFKSPKIAEDIAFSLRGEWDGFNGVIFEKSVDKKALELALEIAGNRKNNFCRAGEYCEISPKESFQVNRLFPILLEQVNQQSTICNLQSVGISTENRKFTHKAIIAGKILYYDVCGERKNAHKDNPKWEYLGEGYIYEIMGVRQKPEKLLHFWRWEDKANVLRDLIEKTREKLKINFLKR